MVTIKEIYAFPVDGEGAGGGIGGGAAAITNHHPHHHRFTTTLSQWKMGRFLLVVRNPVTPVCPGVAHVAVDVSDHDVRAGKSMDIDGGGGEDDSSSPLSSSSVASPRRLNITLLDTATATGPQGTVLPVHYTHYDDVDDGGDGDGGDDSLRPRPRPRSPPPQITCALWHPKQPPMFCVGDERGRLAVYGTWLLKEAAVAAVYDRRRNGCYGRNNSRNNNDGSPPPPSRDRHWRTVGKKAEARWYVSVAYRLWLWLWLRLRASSPSSLLPPSHPGSSLSSSS